MTFTTVPLIYMEALVRKHVHSNVWNTCSFVHVRARVSMFDICYIQRDTVTLISCNALSQMIMRPSYSLPISSSHYNYGTRRQHFYCFRSNWNLQRTNKPSTNSFTYDTRYFDICYDQFFWHLTGVSNALSHLSSLSFKEVFRRVQLLNTHNLMITDISR